MPKEKLQPLQVYQLLPRTNCKLCGLDGCLPFAFALVTREKRLEDCPELQKEEFRSSLKVLSKYFGSSTPVEETGLIIEKEKCHGCGDCAVVCDKALTTLNIKGQIFYRERVPSVLQVIDGVIQVVNWDSCKRCLDPPELCKLCEEKCPVGALELVQPGTMAEEPGGG